MLSCKKKKIQEGMYWLKVEPLILPALNIMPLARTWGIFRIVDGKSTFALIEINLNLIQFNSMSIVTFISTTAIFAAVVLTHASAYSLKQLQFSLRVCGAAPFSVEKLLPVTCISWWCCWKDKQWAREQTGDCVDSHCHIRTKTMKLLYYFN